MLLNQYYTMPTSMSSDILDILDQNEPKIPSGRDLTEEEKERISDWPESRRETFRLTKVYGDPLLIPKEDLERIHNLALAEFPVAAPVAEPNKKETSNGIVFAEKDDTSAPSHLLNYELLWKLFPKRLNQMEGRGPGIEIAKKRIKTREQYNEAVRIIKNYNLYLQKKYPNTTDRQTYTLAFPNFISRIEEYCHMDYIKEARQKQRVKKPWAKPFRPFFPWEALPGDSREIRNQKMELASKLSVEEKKKIEEQLKSESGYNDENNEKWWYET